MYEPLGQPYAKLDIWDITHVCRWYNDTLLIGLMFISVASSMLTDAALYHSQPRVEVWNFLRLYGYWAPCDKSKWFFSIFNHTDLIRAECDKCSRAPKWLLRFELWQEQCRWLLCSHTGGILSFFPSSWRTAACWILSLTQWQSLNGTFGPNFLPLRSSMSFLVFSCA